MVPFAQHAPAATCRGPDSPATPSRCRRPWTTCRDARGRSRPCRRCRSRCPPTTPRDRRFTQWRIDLADVAAGPALRRASGNADRSRHAPAPAPRSRQRRIERLGRRGVHDIERAAGGAARYRRRAARRRPRRRAAGSRSMWRGRPCPSDRPPCARLRSTQASSIVSGMRTHHAAVAARASHRRSRKPSSMSGRPSRAPSPPRLFMKILKLGAPYSRDIARHAGELLFGRDDEVIAEIDARTRFGDGRGRRRRSSRTARSPSDRG